MYCRALGHWQIGSRGDAIGSLVMDRTVRLSWDLGTCSARCVRWVGARPLRWAAGEQRTVRDAGELVMVRMTRSFA